MIRVKIKSLVGSLIICFTLLLGSTLATTNVQAMDYGECVAGWTEGCQRAYPDQGFSQGWCISVGPGMCLVM